jgi:16S rRNA (cytosine1402-N4)-methyltransferase
MSTPTRPHIPVMMAEVLEALSPKAGETYIDGTFGAGGYTSNILDSANCNIIAIDRDQTAIDAGQALVEKFSPRLKLVQNTFGNVEDCVDDKIDGFVLDIGVSSMQLDQAERGFSFMRDGPLDMRMGDGETAAELIARLDETELADLIYKYGEERKSRHIAKAIKLALLDAPITTTLQLADIIQTTIPRRRGDKINPATRTFQALRIAVNDELGELERALEAAIDILKTGGRLVVVTFHSLEDRIVKNFFKDNTDKIESTNKYAKEEKQLSRPFELISRKAILASKDEAKLNPRARSAKLRAAIRTEVPV